MTQKVVRLQTGDDDDRPQVAAAIALEFLEKEDGAA